jgi:hypothetical protein
MDRTAQLISEAPSTASSKGASLITNPAYVAMKAAEEFPDKATTPNSALADRLHRSEGPLS